jgi:tetratricopeptide (TPR) repeat protein
LDGFNGGASDENGLITVGYMADYVFGKMTSYSDLYPGKKQVPIMFGEGNYMIPLAVQSGDGVGETIVAIGSKPKRPSKPVGKISLTEELEALIDQVWDLINEKDYDKAISKCNDIIKRDSKYSRAYFALGYIYNNKKDYDKAITNYTKCINLDPNYATAYNNRGVAYKNKGNYDSAIADYTKAIEIDGDYGLAYRNRGDAYKEKGFRNYGDKAISDYTLAIEIDSKDVYAYKGRGLIYWLKALKEGGRWDIDLLTEALWDFRTAHVMKPDLVKTSYFSVLMNRGREYYRNGDYSAAYCDFDEAVSLYPNDEDAKEMRKKAKDKM